MNPPVRGRVPRSSGGEGVALGRTGGKVGPEIPEGDPATRRERSIQNS